MSIKCQILPTPTKGGVYKSGQLITGVVKYSIDEPTRIPNIILFLKGKLKGKNFWLESRKDLKKKEVFVSLYKIILEVRCNNLQPGDYMYPFEFQLPKKLPSTFRDESCTISYKLSVEFIIAAPRNSIKKFQREIPVYGSIKPSLEEPATAELTKSPFPAYKPIDIEAEIKVPIVVAGENIKLNCLIDNESDIPVAAIRTKLIEETTYIYTNGNKKVRRKTIDGSVMESRGAKGQSESKVTCVVPTSAKLFSIQNSKYFTREYKVNVVATLPFPHRRATLDIPVVIQANDDVSQMEAEHSCCINCLKAILL